MAKPSKFLVVAVLGALSLLAVGEVWNQSNRVRRVELVQRRIAPGGKITVRQWKWNGRQAQNIAYQLETQRDNSCNGCLDIANSNQLIVKISRPIGAPVEQKINLDSGQITPYQNGCLPQLTPQSLKYFQSLVTQNPNA